MRTTPVGIILYSNLWCSFQTHAMQFFVYKIFDICRYGNGKPLMPMAFYVTLCVCLNKISKLSDQRNTVFGIVIRQSTSHTHTHSRIESLFYIIIYPANRNDSTCTIRLVGNVALSFLTSLSHSPRMTNEANGEEELYKYAQRVHIRKNMPKKSKREVRFKTSKRGKMHTR